MAELTNLRIRNYKSIKDSNVCFLDSNITILAGKNEVGKTTILEALEDFNIGVSIRKESIPLSDKKLQPEIELSIKLDESDLRKIFDRFGIQNNKDNNMIIIKTYPNTYTIPTESISGFISEKQRVTERISKLITKLKDRVSNLPIDENYITDDYKRPELKDYTPNFKEGTDKELQEEINKEMDDLKSDVKELNSIKSFQIEFLEFFKREFVPNFILFRAFEDILPNSVPISEVEKNNLLKDLALVSNMNFETIRPNAEPREREIHREEINLRFSSDYKEFWSQDNSKLYVHWDSNNIYFSIKEGSQLYPPGIRSKGKQWHLAFYIRVTARSMEGRKNVILIDEPGLFLHAKAQRDILNKLEECSERNQIIYSTHSPYLIETDRLNRVRLVIKDEKTGTTIQKITARADKETLTPILTAIGEDLSSGIRVDKNNSIVVEGYSDYLYMMSFKKLLNITTEMNFIPAVGGGSPVYVGSILFGWGLDPVFVLDNDRQGEENKNKLKEKLSIEEDRIISIMESGEGCIEDLFSRGDSENYIQLDGQSKVIVATKFLTGVQKEEIKSHDLSDETKSNFRRLFDKIEAVI